LRGGKFPDHLNGYRLLKKVSAPTSYFGDGVKVAESEICVRVSFNKRTDAEKSQWGTFRNVSYYERVRGKI
jgi:hypothetical protein